MHPITREIMKAFPFPQPISKNTGQQPSSVYCVMGAVYLFVNKQPLSSAYTSERFATGKSATEALLTLAPDLTYAQAQEHGFTLTALNDAGKIDEAWAYLDTLLSGRDPRRAEAAFTIEPTTENE